MSRIDDENGYTEVYAWGADRYGQLGLGNKQTGRCYCIPRLCSFNVIIKQIACGEEHSGFITLSGQIFTMGSNNEGRLGIGDKRIKQSSTPCLVEAISKYKAVMLSCGWGHSAAILDNGDLYTWGVGEHGALGQETLESCWAPTKVKMSEPAKICQASCGTRHTAIVDELGQLRMCGSGDAGQLGTGSREKETTPVIIKSVEQVQWASSGIFHTLILNKSGKLFGTGGNNLGQLGIGNKKSINVFVKLKDLEEEVIVKVSAGHHSAAINDKGELYLWGEGTFGKFTVPTKITTAKGIVKDISVGGCFGMALNNEGVLYSWGSNSSGELGVGDYDIREKPVPIQSLTGKPVFNMCCGGFYAMALGKTNTKTRTPIKYDVSPISESKYNYLKTELTDKAEKSVTIDKTEKYSIEKSKADILPSFKKTDEMQTLYEEERKKRKKAESDLYELREQIEELKKGKGGLSELSEMLGGKMEENKRLKEKLSLLDQQLSSTQLDAVKGSNREREVEILKRQIDKKEEEIKIIKESNKSMDLEIKHVKEINAALQKENSKLLEQKTGDNRKLRDILKEYEIKIEKEIEDKHGIINEKAKEISKLLDAINDLEGRLAEKDIIIERTEKENALALKKMEDNYNIETSEKLKETEKVDALKKESELLNADLNSKTEDIHNKDMKISDMESQINKYIIQCNDIDELNKKMSQEAEEYQQKVASLLSENGMLKDELEKIKLSLSQIKENYDKLYEEMQLNESEKIKHINDLKTSIIEEQKAKNDLQTLFNDKSYENEDLIQKISLKQNEIDTMTKEVEGWKEMSDRLGKEGDELRRIIEDLEGKNKKLGETINTQLYNKAAEYKEKLLNSLKNSQSPMRIQKLLSSGKKLNYPQPSPLRLENAIKEENDRKTRIGGVKEIDKMIQFQSQATRNIKESVEKNPMQTPILNTDYIVDQSKYKIENMSEENKLVNSNYEVIQTLGNVDDQGVIKVNKEQTVEITEEQKQISSKEQPQYSTPARDEPIETKINKSANKLMNLLGIESPIRQQIAQQSLGGIVAKTAQEALIEQPLAIQLKSPDNYSFRGVGSGGTTVTGVLLLHSLSLNQV